MLTYAEQGSAQAVAAGLRELVADLSMDDPLHALGVIESGLVSLRGNDQVALPDRWALITTLDQAGKNCHQTLAHQYVTGAPRDKASGMRIWNTCFSFAKTLGGAYLACIEDFQAARPGSAAMLKILPVMAGRTLRALGAQVKWTLQRYELVEERIWRELARVYRFAESWDCAANRVALYPGQHGESSAAEEWLRPMMLSVSGPDSLLAEKLHVAERIVAHFARAFISRPEPAVGCPFFFDLAQPRAPARAYKSMARGTLTRFFGAGDAAQRLRDLARRIRDEGAIPAELYLGGDFNPETVLSVVDHLEEHWSAVPAARNAPRRALATCLTVVPGLPRTLGWLYAAETTRAIQNIDPAEAQNWIVYDTSEGGYGAIVPREESDWLRVGALVGLRTEATATYRVGVVRRIAQDDFGQRRVGIELLGKFAFPVKIMPAGTEAPAAPEDAILLSKQPDEKGEISLLLPPGRFAPNENFQVCVRDKAYAATPATLIERGMEFDWASLRVASP